MRVKSLTFIFSVLFVYNANSQDIEKEKEYISKVSGKIYTNFNYGLNPDIRSTAFELQRAYFGYEKQLSEHFFANVKLDVGSPDDISEFSKLRRYAFFKNAGITYKNGKITAWGGLFDMLQYKIQENFWGYRYLYKSYMDEYRIGPSSDLGAGVAYQLADDISTDLVISNGEGYSSPQRDNTYKAGWGITYNPTDVLTVRSYYSVFIAKVPQMTLSGFAGYNTGKFRLGGEYNYQFNYKFNQNHNRFGYSIYSTYTISDKWEIFLRYDQLYSNLVDDATIPWNLPEDGSALIGGIQFSPITNVNLALDYQDWVEFAGNGKKEQIIYLHLEVKF